MLCARGGPLEEFVVMKAAPFDYFRAESMDHCLELLAQHGGDAKLLAGGQSLVPMMSMRLVRPGLLIDIHRLQELQGVNAQETLFVTGGGVRQCTLEHNSSVQQRMPLLAGALRWVGHEQTRNRGTVGGSLVHADPSAELPLSAATLDATLVLRKQGAERRLLASEFFLGPMLTATAEDECLAAIEWPRWTGDGIGSAFDEIAIRHGDFAMASAAAQLQLDHEGTCERAALGVGGVDGVPLALPRLAERLVGKVPTDDMVRAIAADASLACDPGSDMHATSEYRRHLVAVLVGRVLRQALAVGRATTHKTST
jgi:CO/xanthine dehydrogenase FAD-binding subunit